MQNFITVRNVLSCGNYLIMNFDCQGTLASSGSIQCYCVRVIREKMFGLNLFKRNIYSINCIFIAFTCKLFLYTFALIFRFLEESLVVLQHQNKWLGSSWFSCGVVMLWYQHLWHMTSFLLVFDTFSTNTYLWSCFTILCGQSNWNHSVLSNYLKRMATWLRRLILNHQGTKIWATVLNSSGYASISTAHRGKYWWTLWLWMELF